MPNLYCVAQRCNEDGTTAVPSNPHIAYLPRDGKKGDMVYRCSVGDSYWLKIITDPSDIVTTRAALLMVVTGRA